MKKTKKHAVPKIVAIAAIVVLVLALSGVAYATDIGGIQRTVQIWLHGDQTDAMLVLDEGQYTLTYEDETGEEHVQQGGGMAIDIFGKERPLTEEEMMMNINTPEVVYNDDGTVFVYYKDKKLDITDSFDEDGICYVVLKDGDTSLYITVRGEDDYSISTNKFDIAD